jgi:hypothetical protein
VAATDPKHLAPFLRSLSLSNKGAKCFGPQSHALASEKDQKESKVALFKL